MIKGGRAHLSMKVDTVEDLGADSICTAAGPNALVVRVDGHALPRPIGAASRVRGPDFFDRRPASGCEVDARRWRSEPQSSAPRARCLYDAGCAADAGKASAALGNAATLDAAADAKIGKRAPYGAARLPRSQASPLLTSRDLDSISSVVVRQIR